MNATKPPVCLPLEVKNRDLDGRLYFALKCAQAGYPALIGVRARMRRFVMKNASGPMFYVSKGNNPDHSMLKRIRKMGGYVFLQDEEGAGELFFDGEVGVGFVPTQELVDKVFLWGELQKQYMLDNGAAAEKLLVTGNPRFDLYKPNRIGFYRKLGERLNRPKKYILIASNQAAGNPTLGHEIEKAHLRQMFGDKFDEQAYDRRHEREKYRLDKVTELSRRLAKQYPDTTVVYRPHPAEEMSYYDNLFTEENILVTSEGCSLEWIVDAGAFIHVDCTTGIEAFLVGKEVISYLPPKHMGGLTDAPVEASTVFQNQDEIIERVGEALLNSGESTLPDSIKQQKKKKLGTLFSNVYMESSPAMIAAFDEYNWKSPLPELRPHSFLYRTAKKLRRILKGDRLNTLDLRAKRKFPGLAMEEVRHKVELMREMDPEIPPLCIREYDIDTFLIEPR